MWMDQFKLASVVCLTVVLNLSAAEAKIEFNRDIRPVLSEHCFTCHGPDSEKRKANLRLDQQAGAFAERGGRRVITPGKPEVSSLFLRVSTTDTKRIMPPLQSNKKLTATEIENIRKWIEQGASWQEHWAFVAPQETAISPVKNGSWPRNAMDHFILDRLEKEGLQPSPEASREVLIRRLFLNLTGIPPKPEEVDRFIQDTSVDAYERLVERLLRSARYGEHMARIWLDGARYGDTHGLHLDNERSMWPYRDWVIRAYNSNKPYDQFTIEQLAGDLLPEPSRDQLMGTGFNRCNVTTSEGGAIPEEFAARYAVDRVEAMSTVWLGLTTGCAACHDHKYDPISQREFYQLYAFFNNFDEDPMDGNALYHPPVLKLSTPEQDHKSGQLEQKIKTIRESSKQLIKTLEYKDPVNSMEELRAIPQREYVWVDDEIPTASDVSKDESAWSFTSSPVFSGLKSHYRKSEKTSQHFFSSAQNPLRVAKGDKLFTYVYLDPKNPPKAVMLQFNTDGWDHRAFWGEDLIEMGSKDTPGRVAMGSLPEVGRWTRLEVETSKVGLPAGSLIHGWAFTQYGGTVYWDKSGIISALPQAAEMFTSLLMWDEWQRSAEKPTIPDSIRQVVKTEPAKRKPEQQKQIRDYFIEYVAGDYKLLFDPLHAQLNKLNQERDELDRKIARTYITRELKTPRSTYILKRGQYDNKGDMVFPEVPSILPRLPVGAPNNRLGLAKWLVDPKNPLTARVTVNRLWQQHFGVGLVKTAENFGSQGEPPTHPELLDWLATEFVASGWDVKYMHRLIVHSATFRQSSKIRLDLTDRDPENRLLARGPRFRLDAEAIRDSILSISGLLVEKVGGPGVKPYQPEGIWEAVAYPTSTTAKYAMDDGEALYRRSVYTFLKRTAPPPAMTVFDAPNRESCRVRRERTVTPLQSLALMNDIQYVEAARNLATFILQQKDKTLDQKMQTVFRCVTARNPDAQESDYLRTFYRQQLQEYTQNKEDAKKLISVGKTPIDEKLEVPELAAWTLIANTLLNLSETISVN